MNEDLFKLVWNMIDTNCDEDWVDRDLINIYFYDLDHEQEHLLSGGGNLCDQQDWAKVESSKLRAVYAYFLKLAKTKWSQIIPLMRLKEHWMVRTPWLSHEIKNANLALTVASTCPATNMKHCFNST